jgi:hypothetical protein
MTKIKYQWTIRFFAGNGRQTIIYRENGNNCRGDAGSLKRVDMDLGV